MPSATPSDHRIAPVPLLAPSVALSRGFEFPAQPQEALPVGAAPSGQPTASAGLSVGSMLDCGSGSCGSAP